MTTISEKIDRYQNNIFNEIDKPLLEIFFDIGIHLLSTDNLDDYSKMNEKFNISKGDISSEEIQEFYQFTVKTYELVESDEIVLQDTMNALLKLESEDVKKLYPRC